MQNLDKYVKVDALFEAETTTVLAKDLNFTTRTITTSGNFTYGFPERDGLIMIDEEIIYYEYKTEDIFENCSRGFSGITSYDEGPVRDKLSFTETTAKTHKKGATIKNLNVLFLQQFFKKLKTQIALVSTTELFTLNLIRETSFMVLKVSIRQRELNSLLRFYSNFMDWMLRLLIPLNIFSVLPMQIIRSLKIL